MDRRRIYFSNAGWEEPRVSSLKWDAELVRSFTAELYLSHPGSANTELTAKLLQQSSSALFTAA